MSELSKLTIAQARKKLDAKEISVEELTKDVFKRITAVDPKVEAYVTLCEEEALKKASQLDQDGWGKNDILAGIPLAPKDIFLTEGIKTTCSSHMLENFVPPYSATSIQKCLDAKANIIGKLNMDEFAMGSSNETSYFAKTKNPWNLECVPGGSSGGSAAAIASDMCIATLGTDTGGSIRQPASFCGVVGLKPTYGRVSRYGVIAFASSLDQVGPITKDVRDSALLMNVISGHDVRDSTSVDAQVPDYTEKLDHGVKGLKVGIPKEYFVEGLDPEVKASVQAGIKKLEDEGAIISEVSLPHTEYAVAVYYILAPAEASSNLARFDGVRFGLREEAKSLEEMYVKTKSKGFGREVQRRILLGTYVLSAGYYDAYYRKAQRVRRVIFDDFASVFKDVDCLVAPTAPTTAFKIGEKVDDPIQMYLNDICTIPVNLAGLPALSLPCGLDSKGLPIGMQMIGKPFDEVTLLQVASHFEKVSGFDRSQLQVS